jgi:hypothetical protein
MSRCHDWHLFQPRHITHVGPRLVSVGYLTLFIFMFIHFHSSLLFHQISRSSTLARVQCLDFSTKKGLKGTFCYRASVFVPSVSSLDHVRRSSRCTRENVISLLRDSQLNIFENVTTIRTTGHWNPHPSTPPHAPTSRFSNAPTSTAELHRKNMASYA